MGFAVVGLSVCYDLRFPELYSYLTNRMNAEILLVPSAFTVPTGAAHWEPLLRSRAIENQCVVVAAAQSGAHNAHRTSYGHSMIVDAWGTKVGEVVRSPTEPGDEGVCYFEYNRNDVREIRSKMPVEVRS
jgi:predicted amidohydrolase